MIHYVYKLTNKNSGSYYIGSRSHIDPMNDTYLGSSRVVDFIVQKEGVSVFEKEIIQTFLTRKEALKYESFLIEQALRKEPSRCYNKRSPGKFNKEGYNMRADIWNDYYNSIRQEYRSGLSCRDLAKKYNCDSGTIKKVIKDIQRVGERPELWQKADEIKACYLQGISMTKLSKENKCDIGTIRSILKKNKVIFRTSQERMKVCKKKTTTKTFDLNIIKELYYTQDKPLKEVANYLKVDRETIKRFLIKNNCNIKSREYYNKKRLFRHPIWKRVNEVVKDKETMNLKQLCEKYKVDRGTLAKVINLGRKDPVEYADETGPVSWETAKAYVEKVLAEHSKK